MAEALPRDKYFTNQHKTENCYNGRIMSLYVYFNKKWLKIGEFCRECGAVAIFKDYQNGVPREMKKELQRW